MDPQTASPINSDFTVADNLFLHHRSVHNPSLLGRHEQIERARQTLLYGGAPSIESDRLASWIQQSWQRSLSLGHRPGGIPSFNAVSHAAAQHINDANLHLVQAAKPVLEQLAQAIAGTRYFALLTNSQGVVVDAQGFIDRTDRRADLITKVGVDLSEIQIATTAIGAALHELQPVWLHQGEHFFETTSCYSCAGVPLFGPDGACVGMLDLTGIDAQERPELMHLAAKSARSIENALVLGCLTDKNGLLVRLNWPGNFLGDEDDGLLCLDGDGFVTGANQAARTLLPLLAERSARLRTAAHPALNALQHVRRSGYVPIKVRKAHVAARTLHETHFSRLHCNDLFAMASDAFFNTAQRAGTRSGQQAAVIDVPLWTGLRLNAMAVRPVGAATKAMAKGLTAGKKLPVASAPPAPRPQLKDIETALIFKAEKAAPGSVQQAANVLSVSRTAIHRRLGMRTERVETPEVDKAS